MCSKTLIHELILVEYCALKKSTRPGFFDITERTGKLTEMGDPLVGLNAKIEWEAFRPELNRVHEKARKSNAGAKPIDVVMIF